MNTNPVKDTNINIRLSSPLKADLIAAAESEHLTLSVFVIAVFARTGLWRMGVFYLVLQTETSCFRAV